MENLYDSKKFWIIWFSCLEGSRSIKEIHKLWDYSEGSKALYQPAGTGHEKSIGEEMIEEGYLSVEKEEKKRGATAKQLKSNTEWYTDFIKEEAIDVVDEDKKQMVDNSWEAFENALENEVFRGTAFNMEALSSVLPSKARVGKSNRLLPFVIYVYFLYLHTAYTFIDENMPADPKLVITNGMIGLNDLTTNMLDSSLPVGKYLEKLIENHGLESMIDSIPQESLESDLYEAIEENFKERMNQISQMFGG